RPRVPRVLGDDDAHRLEYLGTAVRHIAQIPDRSGDYVEGSRGRRRGAHSITTIRSRSNRTNAPGLNGDTVATRPRCPVTTPRAAGTSPRAGPWEPRPAPDRRPSHS